MKGSRTDAIIHVVMHDTLELNRTTTADVPRAAHPDAAGGGELNEALARAVVGIHRDLVGRGPTKAHAFFRGNVVVVVLNEVMTPGERTLVASGRSDAASHMRRELHDTMRADLALAVEQLTGASVDALVVDSDVDADTTVALFVLDRPITGRLRAVDGESTPRVRRRSRVAHRA
jgi:uncharacterized protein YbcI